MSHEKRARPRLLKRCVTGFLICTLSCLGAGCSDDAGDPALYKEYCSACHGPKGEGLRSLYPALEGSSYLDQKLDQLPCLIIRGAGNTIQMPGFPQLSAGEISELIVYLNNRWGTSRQAVSEQTVAAWLNSCP